MEAFIYCADIYCGECGRAIRARLDKEGKRPADDSNEYPKGPFADAGGESDCPQHCAGCRCYLGAPLTDAGQGYAADHLWEYTISGGKRGARDVLDQWAEDLSSYSLDGDNQTKLAAYSLFRDEQRFDNA